MIGAERLALRRRRREIIGALTRHGLGFLVGAPRLGCLVPFHWGALGHERRQLPYTRPEHVRLGLEELGATFVKLGQILSTRGDLLAPPYQRELAQLQDGAPPEPVARIRDVIQAELGRPLEELFASFGDVPLAAASIGQAHGAILHDGRHVVVKVRRPGVVEQVELDLRLLGDLAARAERRWAPAADYGLVDLVREFSQTLRYELDYRREAANATRIAANLATVPGVHIPAIVDALSTGRVLTLERIDGIGLGDLSELDAAGIDRSDLARQAARVTLHMVFVDGFFHADPHPGNVFVEPGGRIALVDFGMVGSVDSATRRQLVAALLAAAGHDDRGLVDAFAGLGLAGPGVDRTALGADLAAVVQRLDQPLGETSVGSLLGDLVTVLRRHHLRLPTALALLVKTVAMSEGVGSMLDPQFRLMEVLVPFAASVASSGVVGPPEAKPDEETRPGGPGGSVAAPSAQD